MENGKPTNNDTIDHSLDNARAGYNAAINLWIYEGTTIWAKFSAMVCAHTILIAAIGLIITSSNACTLFKYKVVLSILGLLLCVSWLFLTKRSYEYYKYWVFSAKEIEQLYLVPVKTISRGASYSEVQRVSRGESYSELQPIDLPKLPNFKIEHISYFIMIIFSIVYFITLFY